MLHSTQLPLCCHTKPAALCSWHCHHSVCCCQSLTAAAIQSATEDISPVGARNPSNGTAQAGAHCGYSTQLPLCCLTKPAALCSGQCHHLVCCCQSLTAAAIESATEVFSQMTHVTQATAQHKRAHTALHSTQLPLCCLTKPAALCSWQCHHLVCCCQMTAAAIEGATEDISPDDARNPSNGTAQAGTHCVALHAVAALLPHQTSCSLQLAVPPLSLLLPIIDGSCNRKRH